MNRIATRSMILVVFISVLVCGFGFFVWEYVTQSDNWIISESSPHFDTRGQIKEGVVVDCQGQLLFQARLHRCIQSQDHAAPFGTLDIIFIRERHIHLVIAFGGNHFSGAAGKVAVIGRLHSLGAVTGSIGKADDLCRQRSVGVHSPGVWFQMDA